MKRKIIKINQDLCNGCGDCVVGCAEGALQIIDGKAKLIKEDCCDGFGDCIGTCPTGALTIEEREAIDFDEKGTIEYLEKTQGKEAVKKMQQAQKIHKIKQKVHGKNFPNAPRGCPSSRIKELKKEVVKPSDRVSLGTILPSDLAQWPIQIHLVSPTAPYFNGKELVIMSTCSPLASADTHWRYLRGRSVVVGCPKLDRTEPYAQKLASIFKANDIPKVIVVRMEVPCCGGIVSITNEARKLCGKDIKIVEDTISIEGNLIGSKEV